MRTHRTLVLSLLALAVAAAPAHAAVPGAWSLDGFAWAPAPAGGTPAVTTNNYLALRFEPTPLAGAGAVSLQPPAGWQIEDIASLSFDAFFESGGCGGGSPRAVVGVDRDGDGATDGHVHVYAGDAPFGEGCMPVGEWSHQQLVDGVARWDATQLGGAFYGTQADAHAAAGEGHAVTAIRFVWDSAWMFGPSVVWFDNLEANGHHLGEPGASDAFSVLRGAGVG